MLCRVDPLVVKSECRRMRRNQSRRVLPEEATRRQKQLSSRLLLQAGGKSCVAFKFPPSTGSTERAIRRYRGREQSSSLHLLSRGEKSMAAPTRMVWRAIVDLTSQPPGTSAGCGSRRRVRRTDCLAFSDCKVKTEKTVCLHCS